jgi:hypothetical protein
MPYYPHLIAMLRASPLRLNIAAEVNLNVHEAELLRACGFPTAVAGGWKIPPLPAYVVRLYGLPPYLAAEEKVEVPLTGPTSTPVDHTTPKRTYRTPFNFSTARVEQLRPWLLHAATSDQRRVLVALVRHATDQMYKRTLQRNLHRLPAPRLNPALQGLIEVKLVTRDGPWLEIPQAIRQALIAAGLPVSRQRRPRALAVKRRARRWYVGRDGRLRGQTAFVGGRRTLPPVGTPAWGRAMRAKRGGYARQKKCRLLEICPTTEATRARLLKHQQAKAHQR